MKKIGQGDWGEIFLHDGLIVKMIYKADSTSEMLAKIKQGVEIQNQLANLGYAPRVYKIGSYQGRIWIKMEYLEGYQAIHDTRADELDTVAKLLKDNNISHGDINSGNIMVSPEGDIKLIDFDQACYQKCGNQDDRDMFQRIANLYGS